MEVTETGRVVAIEADGVWVETIRQSTCGSCSARKGCGHGLLNRGADGRSGYIRVLPGRLSLAELAVDDQVRFAIPGSVIVRGSLVVYALPLLLLLVGAVAGSRFATGTAVLPADLYALAGAGLGFTIGAVAVRWHARLHRGDVRLQPTLVARLASPAVRTAH